MWLRQPKVFWVPTLLNWFLDWFKFLFLIKMMYRGPHALAHVPSKQPRLFFFVSNYQLRQRTLFPYVYKQGVDSVSNVHVLELFGNKKNGAKYWTEKSEDPPTKRCFASCLSCLAFRPSPASTRKYQTQFAPLISARTCRVGLSKDT